jgi:hypothetical protein
MVRLTVSAFWYVVYVTNSFISEGFGLCAEGFGFRLEEGFGLTTSVHNLSPFATMNALTRTAMNALPR